MPDVWSEVQFAHLTVKNRIARSATNDYMGNEDGTVSDRQKVLYKGLAAGGAGLIFTGHYAVQPLGRNDIHQNALWNDRFIAGQRELVRIVHDNGAKIVAQLNHAGAKAQDAAIDGLQPVAPSAVTLAPGKLARALRADEIMHITDAFADAALRAKQAGFDGVQLHCAHGYLLSQFLDPSINTRTDAYGGSADNRLRIVGETLRKMKMAAGEDYPIFIKINSNSESGGFTEEQLGRALVRARSLGVEAAEVSGFDFRTRKPADRLYYLERAAFARHESGLPVLLVGGIRSIEDIEAALGAGLDMISMSRPFICQPDIPQRLRAGEASKCVGCLRCFTDGKRCAMLPDEQLI